ncbi:hypothetical protein BJ978_000103 [Agromyces terreus]|uniref:Integral membrane protein n=1 Tax=Agromyces terreus TaxID=424795 RepID=A0A9X2GVM1_9MICO|nr:hypothetical protein [Agromyces terreus]MCP2369427.1 hypothetical protein [Agromyces terreus]
MAQTRDDELLARIEALEAENARLREEAVVPREASAGREPKRSTGRARVAVATILVLVGAILAPVAVLGGWAKNQLVDTDTFVATFAPIAEDPAVQAYVSDEATAAIIDAANIESLTSSVFDGISELGLPPKAEQALQLLEGPAAQGIESLIGQIVNRFVTSDAFGEIFEQALRTTHTQTIAALQGDPDAALHITDSGEIGIQLGPIIEAVKERLVDAGVGFASSIPAIDKTIVVAKSESLATVQLAYGLAVSAGTWLPWVALAFLIGGILVAPRRRTAIIWTASTLAVVLAILASGFGIGRLYFIGSVSPGIVPTGAAEVIYDQIVDRMFATTIALVVFAVIVALFAWMSGPGALPTRLRGFADSGFGAVRRSAAERGLTTGSFGAWLGRQRGVVFGVIMLAAVAVILFVRPISTGLVVWTLVIALVLIAIVELLQRPPAEVAAAEALAAEAEASALLDEEPVPDAAADGDTAVLVGVEEGSATDTAVLVEASGAEVDAEVAEDARATDVIDVGEPAPKRAPRSTSPKKRGRPAE